MKSFEDLQNLKEKYLQILDDAEEVINSITPENFSEFIKGLPNAMDVKASAIDDAWARTYGAIVLPRLFLQLIQYPDSGMGTGFVMHRLVDEGLAGIVETRFKIFE